MITTPEGVGFRPNLLATTSFDGSMATTFKRTVTATVCDNTGDFALAEAGLQLKVRHSRWSTVRLAESRDALELVHTTAGAFSQEVQKLCRVSVTESQWSGFLDAHVPAREGLIGALLVRRSRTVAGSDSRYLFFNNLSKLLMSK